MSATSHNTQPSLPFIFLIYNDAPFLLADSSEISPSKTRDFPLALSPQPSASGRKFLDGRQARQAKQARLPFVGGQVVHSLHLHQPPDSPAWPPPSSLPPPHIICLMNLAKYVQPATELLSYKKPTSACLAFIVTNLANNTYHYVLEVFSLKIKTLNLPVWWISF